MALVSNLAQGPRIGAGHYGEVYLAIDDVHGEVAVKVLTRLPEEDDSAWSQRRDGLLREARHLAAATHRNVVQVYQFLADDDGESIRFSMRLCRGGSLQDRFESGPMNLAAVRKVATEVTFGLQALHQRGMLHRDIKPANMLLDEHGVALLSDFGWVTDDIRFGYARAGGYLDHIAYESWHSGASSVRTDIWALGMTLYRLLHGQKWYERQGTPRERIRNGGFVDTLIWLPHVPAKWKRVIRRMLNDDPAARFQNCEQLLAAFADLPVEPDWECCVEDDRIHWSRTARARRHQVEWSTQSARRHEWRAWTEPLAQGRPRRAGGSTAVLGGRACASELSRFFAEAR